MKTRLGALLAFLFFTVLIAWGVSAAPEEKIPHFAFVLQQTKDGVKMKCEAGCAWKELSYSCNGKVPCCSRVDERGVRGAPCPTEGE